MQWVLLHLLRWRGPVTAPPQPRVLRVVLLPIGGGGAAAGRGHRHPGHVALLLLLLLLRRCMCSRWAAGVEVEVDGRPAQRPVHEARWGQVDRGRAGRHLAAAAAPSFGPKRQKASQER